MLIIINGGLDILPAYELIISYQFLRVNIKKKLFCYLFCEFSFLIAIFRVCLSVRTSDIFFLFHLLVLGCLALLFSLFYVIREFDWLLHQGSAKIRGSQDVLLSAVC